MSNSAENYLKRCENIWRELFEVMKTHKIGEDKLGRPVLDEEGETKGRKLFEDYDKCIESRGVGKNAVRREFDRSYLMYVLYRKEMEEMEAAMGSFDLTLGPGAGVEEPKSSGDGKRTHRRKRKTQRRRRSQTLRRRRA
jgi:hypothetical protein